MKNRDNGTEWIAEYCSKKQISYPEWLGTRMTELPRHVATDDAISNKYFQFDVSSSEEEKWSQCIIWVIENLESSWTASGEYIWLETEEDAVAFKLGCL